MDEQNQDRNSEISGSAGGRETPDTAQRGENAGAPPSRSTNSSESSDAGREQQKKPGCILKFLALIGGVTLLGIGLIVLSIATVMSGILATSASEGMGQVQEEVVEGDPGQPKIAVIEVKGMIGREKGVKKASSEVLRQQLTHAREDPQVAGVILDMNSPGGEVTACDQVYQETKQLAEAGKPIVTSIQGMGASGGYMVAAASDHIIANRLSITGSIGVIMGTLNYSDFLKEHHLDMEVYKSGAMKDILSGARDRTQEEEEYIDSLIHYTFKEFAKIVAENRSEYEDWQAVESAEFGDGRMITGEKAQDYGLVDETGYMEDAVKKARELVDEPETAVVRYKPRFGLADFLESWKYKLATPFGKMLPSEQRLVKKGHMYYLLPSAVE